MYAGKAGGRRGPHRGVGVTRGGQLRRRASGDRALKGPTPHAPSSCLPAALLPLPLLFLPSPLFLSRLSLLSHTHSLSLSFSFSLCWCHTCAFKVSPSPFFRSLPFLALFPLVLVGALLISRSLSSRQISTRRRGFSRLSPGISG